MKLPISVQTKRSMIVNEAKPTSEKAMLTAPKKSGQQQRPLRPLEIRRMASCEESRLFFGS